jgi:hypothetical protein
MNTDVRKRVVRKGLVPVPDHRLDPQPSEITRRLIGSGDSKHSITPLKPVQRGTTSNVSAADDQSNVSGHGRIICRIDTNGTNFEKQGILQQRFSSSVQSKGFILWCFSE